MDRCRTPDADIVVANRGRAAGTGRGSRARIVGPWAGLTKSRNRLTGGGGGWLRKMMS